MGVIKHSDFLSLSRQSIPGKGSLELLDTRPVKEQVIERIFDLESDMWAHGLGEYRSCPCCGEIYGKYDVFRAGGHGSDLLKKTVNEIERILAYDHKCESCGTNTNRVFGSDYKYDICDRYSKNESILCVLKDMNGTIRGFMDGYVGTIDTIYDTEFSHYYEDIGREGIVTEVSTYFGEAKKKLLCITSLGTDQESGNMFNIYLLMRFFFEMLARDYGSIDGVYESVLGTNTHGFYSACGGKRTFICEKKTEESKRRIKRKSDIFVHKDIASTSYETLGLSLKDFLGSNKRHIRETIEKYS